MLRQRDLTGLFTFVETWRVQRTREYPAMLNGVEVDDEELWAMQ
jgi:hypothetical protein